MMTQAALQGFAAPRGGLRPRFGMAVARKGSIAEMALASLIAYPAA